MPDEKIEVEWIATATKMTQVLQRIDGRLDKQEKQLQKIGTTSKKSADMAAGSFNKLEQELKQNEAALKKLQIGSKEFEQQKRKVDQLRASLTKAKNEIGASGSRISSVFQTGIGKLGTLVAGMAGFQSIVSAVVAELEKAKTLRIEASATTKTFEQALADVGMNIGADAIPEAKAAILEQAPKLGTTQEGLANLIGIAISAGAKDIEEAMSLSTAALKLTVGDAQRAATLVGGTLDIASLGGSKNFEGALGQLLQVQSQVRSTNAAEFAKNIGPGLAAATAQGQNMQGMSTERALEISSVISQIIKDPTGGNTATALRQFKTRMDAFVPQDTKTMKDGSVATVSQEQIEAFRQANTFDQRLQMMRSNEGIRRQFLDKQEEGIGKTAVMEIIGASDRAVEFEQKAAAAITSIDNAQGFFTDLTGAIGGETAQLNAGRRAQAAIQTAEIRGDRDLEGTVLDIVEKTLDKVNLSGLDVETRKKIGIGILQDQAAGTSAVDTGINALRTAQEQRKIFGLLPGGGQVSTEDKALIEEQIAILRRMELLLSKQQPGQPAQPQRPKVAPLPAATVP